MVLLGYIAKRLVVDTAERTTAVPTTRGNEARQPVNEEVQPVVASVGDGLDIVEIARRYLGHRYVLRRNNSKWI